MRAMDIRQSNGPLLLAAVIITVSLALGGVHGAPASATDVFKSPCPPITNPVYKRWSNKATWASGVVPGVTAGVEGDVVIPCGTAVMLDVANITINGVLQIKGLLTVMDSPSIPKFYVKSRHVLVEGKLAIGSFTKQFSQKITFELTPSPNRAELRFTSFLPATARDPRLLGHKAFVTIGGQVDLHGMPGGSSTPSWCFLSATTKVGDKQILVNDPRAIQWPVGSHIAVATTDYDYLQSEDRTITAVSSTTGGVLITLNSPLIYSHNGVQVSDGMGGLIDQRAEVILISRNIVVTGTDEQEEAYKYMGGHFMINQTPDPPQYVEGVEFYKMGQQGCLGRYSLHFHVNGNSPQSIALKNSVHESKQRCIVVHATHNMMVKQNVAYRATGHCFSLEEGGEQGNTFDSNVAITGVRAINRIPGESDQNPSQFWISAPNNILINNRAVGSLDTGYWFETRKTVRGMSLAIPSLRGLNPTETAIKRFKGNVAHSCHNVGLRTYPTGIKPVKGATGSIGSEIQDMLVYKQASRGFFIHQSQFLTISGTFADCGIGILLLENRAIRIRNSRFVGLTTNYGTPHDCYKVDKRQWYLDCAPTDGTCMMPLKPGGIGRTHSGYLTDPIYGIQISQERRISGHTFPCSVENSRFSLFNYTCATPGVSSGIIPVAPAERGSSFNPHFSLKGVQFFTGTVPVFFPPQVAKYDQLNQTAYLGEAADYIVMKDVDGSLVGGSGGSIVSNNVNLTTDGCTFLPSMNAYGCRGTCYRTLRIEYGEPGFQLSNKKANKPGDWSALRITRVEDGRTLVMNGNLNDPKSTHTFPTRVYFLPALVGYTYELAVVPSKKQPLFYPTYMTLNYHDDDGSCPSFVRVRVQPPVTNPSLQWVLDEVKTPLMYRICNGASPQDGNSTDAPRAYTCVNNVAYLDVQLSRWFTDVVWMYAIAGSQACLPSQSCNIQTEKRTDWLWDASGIDNRPAFYDPSADTSFFNTGGEGIFGYNNVNTGLTTILPVPSATRRTYLFRRTFTVSNIACLTSITFQVMFEDGIVGYLQGTEVFRMNMPLGAINSSTLALVDRKAWLVWENFTIPFPDPMGSYGLVEGVNTVAAEVHVFSVNLAKRMQFDMRIIANKLENCPSANPPPPYRPPSPPPPSSPPPPPAYWPSPPPCYTPPSGHSGGGIVAGKRSPPRSPPRRPPPRRSPPRSPPPRRSPPRRPPPPPRRSPPRSPPPRRSPPRSPPRRPPPPRRSPPRPPPRRSPPPRSPPRN